MRGVRVNFNVLELVNSYVMVMSRSNIYFPSPRTTANVNCVSFFQPPSPLTHTTDPSFVEALKYKDTLPRDGNMHDVYNAELYERHADFFEASKHHISVTWHTDGVQVSFSCF